MGGVRAKEEGPEKVKKKEWPNTQEETNSEVTGWRREDKERACALLTYLNVFLWKRD